MGVAYIELGGKALANLMVANQVRPVMLELVQEYEKEGYQESRAKEIARVLKTLPGGETEEDARTLPIQFDEQEERWRGWRSVLSASSENYYDDWPVEGPRTCLWLMKHIERTGGSPMQWYTRYLAENKVAATSRIAYELQVLSRYFEYAGCYDMLNLPSLSCFEMAARRWQLLLDANSRDPGEGRFEDEAFWSGLQQSTLGIAPALTSHVAARTKEKADIETPRQKAKEVTPPKAAAGKKS